MTAPLRSAHGRHVPEIHLAGESEHKGRLWRLAIVYLVGVAIFVSVGSLRGDQTSFWTDLIQGAIVIGVILGGSVWTDRMTRSDSGKALLFAFSILFASTMGAMIWRGFNWLLFTIATAGLLVGFGGYWLSRQEQR